MGKLYVCPQGFYIAETDPDNYGNDYTNLYDPKTGETLIVMLSDANEEYTLCSVDEEGNVTELGKIGDAERGYAEPRQLIFDDGDIYVVLGYFEGTGHFL